MIKINLLAQALPTGKARAALPKLEGAARRTSCSARSPSSPS